MDSKKNPLWKMALMASPDSFGSIPANFTLPLHPKEAELVEQQEQKQQADSGMRREDGY